MSLKEEFTLFHLAAHFIEKENFKILHMNQPADELWLIKLNKNNSKIIRIAKQEFNWKNELKKDIVNVFRKIQLMKKSFTAKNIEIYNVYVTQQEPIDNWESLKKPLTLKDKKPMKMNVFYLSSINFKSERSRLLSEIESPIQEIEPNLTKQEKHAFVKLYKTKIVNKLAERYEAEQQKLHTYGKSRINYLFVSINIIIFFILNFSSIQYFQQINDLTLFNKVHIVNGEWWRLISSLFVHNGVFHVVITVLILYYLGTLIERNFGSIRFVIIFLLAGIGTNLIYFAFSSNNLIIGTTGALFGLLGALFVFTLYHRKLYIETLGKNIIYGFMILILTSILFPALQLYPYIGSFFIGFIAANITYLPNKKAYLLQFSSGLLLLLLFSLLIMIGLY